MVTTTSNSSMMMIEQVIAAVEAAAAEATRGSDLPAYLVLDIVSRLPQKTLVRFRCLSKPWLNFITFSRFPQHLLAKRNLHICPPFKEGEEERDQHLCPFQVQNELLLFPNKSSMLKGFYSIGGGYSDQQYKVGNEVDLSFLDLDFGWKLESFEVKTNSCDGLLCLKCTCTKQEGWECKSQDILVLWNPSIRDHKVLPLGSDLKICEGVCGLGYDPTIDDYKVVSVINRREFHVFSVKRNSWKTVKNRDSYVVNKAIQKGVAANGCLYWIVSNPKSDLSTILCLDLSNNAFTVVPSPDHFEFSEGSMILLPNFVTSVSEGGGGGNGPLYAYQVDERSLWVMKEKYDRDNNPLPWNHILTIPHFGNDNDRRRLHPLFFTRSGKLLMIQTLSKQLLLYNPASESYEEFFTPGLGGLRYRKEIVYRESLISPLAIRGMDDID